jgi:hypothetical protein
MAYSVWFQRYAISYQPYANYTSEIFLSSLQSEFFSMLLVQGAWIGVYDSTTLGSIAKQRLDVSVGGNG